MTTLTMDQIDVEFEAIVLADAGTEPTDLPDWMTKDPMLPTPQTQDDYAPRHSTGRERCPWLDVEASTWTGTLAVQEAAQAAMLDLPVTFIKSPTAKHAHDGTALAMIDHAAAEIGAALASRSVPRGRLRTLLNQLQAMVS